MRITSIYRFLASVIPFVIFFNVNGQPEASPQAVFNPSNVVFREAMSGLVQPILNLAAGESTRVSYPGVNNGPVRIESNQAIVAAQRVIYTVKGVQTSFSEMMALPDSQVDTTYWLPWYNHVGLDSQLRLANVSGSPATVRVYIGGVEMPGSPFQLPTGGITRKVYAGVNHGPVQIVSDQNIIAAQRVIYRVNALPTSFSELMGLPAPQLDTLHWLPWYNNVGLESGLRFAAP